MIFTRTLMKVAHLAIGGLLMILYFRGAFSKGASYAGQDIGSSFASLGTGLGTGLGSVGSGISSLGEGFGSGISGLFKPFWELKNLIGLGETSSTPSTPSPSGPSGPSGSSGSSSAKQRVDGTPRSNASWSVATHATSGGRVR